MIRDDADAPLIIEPEPKAARFLLLPTLLISSLALFAGVYGLIVGRVPILWALVLMLIGSSVSMVALVALTLRGRVVIDPSAGTVAVQRKSWVWRSSRHYVFTDFDRVDVRTVKGGAGIDQPQPIGAYAMVWLAGDQRVHVASMAGTEAELLAERLSRCLQVPVVRS